MGKKSKQKQGRPNVTDVSAVKNAAGEYVVSRSYAEVVDLISEGEIEGIVSGSYHYKGDQTKVTAGNNPTGYIEANFTHYTATGIKSPTDAGYADQLKELGFLRSIYWNSVPVVDKDGYYNFASVNIDSSVGLPAGHKPNVNTQMNNYTGLTGEEVLDLSVYRSIGERLYGAEIEGGDLSPTDTKRATLKSGSTIDKYSKTYSILNKECSRIDLRIKIAGLFEQVQAGPKTYEKNKQLAACAGASTGYGDMKARTVAYSVYYQPIFDERFVSPSSPSAQKNQQATNKWLGPIRETVTGKLDSPYIRTTTIPPSGNFTEFNYQDLPGFEGWRIRIVRTTPESLTSFLRNTTFVDSLTEVYGTTLLYPYSSMIYSQFDARSFSRIPSRAYDAKLIKVKVPNNYDPILKTYGKSDGGNPTARTGAGEWSNATPSIKSGYTLDDSFWDGEFKNSYWDDDAAKFITNIQGKYFLEWTDNPAWCFYDMLTNPRYGLGEYIKEKEIDKWALYEIAQYCDGLVPDSYGSLEPRFTINHIISSREEAYKVMNDLASIFRGMIFYANGSIFAVQDKFKKAVYQFNNSNVADGNFTYSSSAKKARHTVAIVRYNDKRDLFKPTIEYVENEEAVRRYGIREIETSALGCTSRGQARRFAQWILASEAEETETVSFSAGQEGAYLQPGDVVQIYDNFRSPLKYSGRTNAVIPGATSTNVVTANEITPASGNNFNSIILDQALNFTSDNLYKFSLLTPTYNYDANTDGLNTTDENEIRRSQIQNLVFSGAHVRNVTGSYRSDYMEGGSGVCTQIFFNTGTFFGGMDNSLNFDDYVITGYTNTGVNVYGNSPDQALNFPYSQSYSGGCFSGENLVWSIEPDDSNDTEFISGNFSNYRIINVKESEENTYEVSALAYSTGKYNKVEDSTKLEGKNVDRQPIFATGENDGTNTIIDSSALIVEAGTAYSTTTAISNYTTIDIKFGQAGYTRTKDIDVAGAGKVLGLVDEDANDELQYIICSLPTDPASVGTTAKAVTVDSQTYREIYQPHVVEMINGEPTEDKTDGATDQTVIEIAKYYKIQVVGSGSNFTDFGAANNITEGEQFLAIKSGTLTGTGKVTNLIPVNPRYKGKEFHSEVLIGETLNSNVATPGDPGYPFRWIALFAISPQGVLSQAFIQKTADLSSANNNIFSAVNSIQISNLKTEGNEGPESRTGGDDLITIEAAQPGFVWNSSIKGLLSADPSTNEPSYPLPIPEDSTEYRITIRKPATSDEPNKPNDIVYVEITGYNTTSESPNFVFNEIYNNPTLISGQATNGTTKTGYRYDPEVIGWKDGAPIDNWAGKDNNQKDASEAQWLTVHGSGFNISNDINNFPVRNYDIVIEAQDSQGNTSAGNKVFQNTRLKGATENGEVKGGEPGFDSVNINKSYDILGVSLAAPQSVFYTQITGSDSNWNKQTRYLTPETAFDNDMPYLAKAHIYPDGWLQTTMLLSERDGTIVKDPPNVGVVQDAEEIGKKFTNAKGMVYYYTTGNHEIEYIDTKEEGVTVKTTPQLTNSAPAFSLNMKFLGSPNNAGTEQPLQVSNTEHIAFGGIVNAAQESNKKGDSLVAGNVHRGFYLFSDSDSLEALRIPFPKISDPRVSNIQLSYALFDEYHLLSAFESDGSTPKTETRSPASPINAPNVQKIFTEKNMNFSKATTPMVDNNLVGQTEGAIFGNRTIGVSQSIYLSESSVQSAGDAALGFRAWGSINIIRGGKLNDLGSGLGDLTQRILDTEWRDGRQPMVLKTFTPSDVLSITAEYAGGGLLRIIVNLRVPQAIDKSKIAVIANGYYPKEGVTCTVDVDTHSKSDEIQLTYKFVRTKENASKSSTSVTKYWPKALTAPSGFQDALQAFNLFFGILATNE